MAQLKAYGENKRVKRVRNFAKKISNGLVDPIVRSISASAGNHQELGSELLHSAYLLMVKDKVFAFKDKYTGMSLMHYACEYGCTRFLQSVCKARGPKFFLQMVCCQSRNGKNGLHFMASNHGIHELNFFFKVVRSLKRFTENCSGKESNHEEE